MKRKGMHRRRKWVLLAVLLIMVGIAVWRIWQTPRPTVLHRQDAWLSSAEPEMVDTLPDNAFTAELPAEIDGRLLYIRDYSASGHYQIVWEGVSAEAAESYLTALLDKGFTRLMGTAEDIASGVLLARGDLTLSISLSGGMLNMLMTRAASSKSTFPNSNRTSTVRTLPMLPCRSIRWPIVSRKRVIRSCLKSL